VAFLVVEILHFSLFEIGRFKGVNGAVGPIQHDAVDHVSKLAPVEGLALAGFCELKINDHIRLFIDKDLETLSQVAGVVHESYPFFVRWFAIFGNIGKSSFDVKGKPKKEEKAGLGPWECLILVIRLAWFSDLDQ
jgi:hypothetical protein